MSTWKSWIATGTLETDTEWGTKVSQLPKLEGIQAKDWATAARVATAHYKKRYGGPSTTLHISVVEV